MKAFHVMTCAVALMTLSSSDAFALTGNYDGDYSVGYTLMDTRIQCGDFSEELTVDLEDEQLPADAFDAIRAEVYGEIEAADLTERRQQAAMTATDIFFAGLTELANGMLLSYPDTISISALAGTQDLYAFISSLTDTDFVADDQSLQATTVGYMDGGDFEMLPFNPVISLEDYDLLNDYVSAIQVGANANGWVEDGVGEGELEWSFEVQSTGLVTGESLNCRVSNLVGFELSR